ncbi:recombinase family protein [Kaistia nematophila]|uniref:Recombinase family protein n=1 Tax=Kaistia nematophila TaxID=2994654 RepID=A0A9X3E721_9HYPH|nr:recombinase family protein [Kaistia nematophila]MCX5572318.1 recombinase family protein [Kaistia nematophila]
MTKPKAYSYIRWSTAIQGQGDSGRRQSEMAERYAAEHKLDFVSENVVKDEGQSAYTGQNVSSGALGTFLQAISEGQIEPGSYLLVESLDRISRQHPMDAMNLLHRIVDRDIVVVTMLDNVVYRKPIDPMQMLTSLVHMIRANEESAVKASRIRASWARKREAISHGLKMTANCPGWLTLSPDRRTFLVNDERVAIVRRIFQMSIDGHGIYTIAKTLNREAVPTFRGRSHWQVSAVRMGVLRNRAVIGEFQPQLRRGGVNEKIPEGEPIKDYFPAIVSEETFYAAQASMERRSTQGVGAKGKRYANIFTGLAFCGQCGAKMYVNQHNRYKSSKIIYCSQIDNGSCNTRPWGYDHFEKSFLSFVQEIDLEAVIEGGVGSRNQQIGIELDRLAGEKLSLDDKLERLVDAIETGSLDSSIINNRMKLYQKRLNEIAVKIIEFTEERSKLLDSRRGSKEKYVTDFPVNISDEDLYNLRAKTAEQIRAVVESIHMSSLRPAKNDDPDVKKLLSGWPSLRDPRYLVRFRGGGGRMIWTKRDNPAEVFLVKDMADESLVNANYSDWLFNENRLNLRDGAKRD